MKTDAEDEQRNSVRYEVSLPLVAQEVSSVGVSNPRSRLSGHTQNLSNGGLCAMLNGPCRDAGLMRCEIFVPSDNPIAIPTLMRIRWVRNEDHGCRAGLEFLLLS